MRQFFEYIEEARSVFGADCRIISIEANGYPAEMYTQRGEALKFLEEKAKA